MITALRLLAQWLLVAAAVIALVDDRPGAATIYLVLFAIVSVVHAAIPIERQRARSSREGVAPW